MAMRMGGEIQEEETPEGGALEEKKDEMQSRQGLKRPRPAESATSCSVSNSNFYFFISFI